MKSFDDYEGLDLPEDAKAEVAKIGEMAERHDLESDEDHVVEKRKILRVKPISAHELTKDVINGNEAAENLWFKQHPLRPGVFWLIEVE